MLIKKIVQVSDKVWCFEESRLTPGELEPTVHSQIFRMGDVDVREPVDAEEFNLRMCFRAIPNVLAISMFFKNLSKGVNHFSLVENTFEKRGGSTWGEWYADW